MLLEQIDAKLLAEAARIAEDKVVEHAIEDRDAEKDSMAPHLKPDGALSGCVVALVTSVREAVREALRERPGVKVDETIFLVGVVAMALAHGIRIGMEYERLKNGSRVENVST